MGQTQNMDDIHARRQENPGDRDSFADGSQWALNKKRHEEMAQKRRGQEREIPKRVEPVRNR